MREFKFGVRLDDGDVITADGSLKCGRGAIGVKAKAAYPNAVSWFAPSTGPEFVLCRTVTTNAQAFELLFDQFWEMSDVDDSWFLPQDQLGYRQVGDFWVSKQFFALVRDPRCRKDKNVLAAAMMGVPLPEPVGAVPVSGATIVDRILPSHRIADGNIGDRGQSLLGQYPDASFWFAIDGKCGFMESLAEGDPLDHVVELMWERKAWEDSYFDPFREGGFRVVGEVYVQKRIWLSRALFNKLRTKECREDKEYLRAVVHGKPFMGAGQSSAITTTDAKDVPSAYVNAGNGPTIRGESNTIKADANQAALVAPNLGIQSIVRGGNGEPVVTSGGTGYVPIVQREGETEVAKLTTMRGDIRCYGKLIGVPDHALLYGSGPSHPNWPAGVSPCYDDKMEHRLPVTFLETQFGDVVVKECSASRAVTLEYILGECLGPARVKEGAIERAFVRRDNTCGEWFVEASPETWAKMEGWVLLRGHRSVQKLAQAMMIHRSQVQQTEGETMAKLANLSEEVEGPQQEKTVKARAKRAAKKAGKDAVADAKEAFFRGTVRNTVKEVHGTAVTIAKGVSDDATAQMVVAALETERGRAAVAAIFGMALGFTVDMMEGDHPALERIARELKVENGSVLMDPLIGAVLAPIAAMFAKVCLMAGDKSAADQVARLTAPLQLVAAGGTLLSDEVRVAEKAVK